MKTVSVNDYVKGKLKLQYAQLLSNAQKDELVKRINDEILTEVKGKKEEGEEIKEISNDVKAKIKKYISDYMEEKKVLKDFIEKTKYTEQKELNNSIVKYICTQFNGKKNYPTLSSLKQKELTQLTQDIATAINAIEIKEDVKKINDDLKEAIDSCIKTCVKKHKKSESVSETKSKKSEKKDKSDKSEKKEKSDKSKKIKKKEKSEKKSKNKTPAKMLRKLVVKACLDNLYSDNMLHYNNGKKILSREIPQHFPKEILHSTISAVGVITIAAACGISFIAIREYLHQEIATAMFNNLDQFAVNFAKMFNLSITNPRFVVTNMVDKLNIVSDISHIVTYVSFAALALLPLIFASLKIAELYKEFNGPTEDIAKDKEDSIAFPILMGVAVFTASLSVATSAACKDLQGFLLTTYDNVISTGNNALVKTAFVDQASVDIKMYIAAGVAFAMVVAGVAAIISSNVLTSKLPKTEAGK